MKTTNPNDYIELIEMFSIGLTNGLIDKSEIVKWAKKSGLKISEKRL